jgi:hypothetical protein
MVAANYGLFVAATRSLAGHESYSIAQKKALIADVIDWYEKDCPKRQKAERVDAFTAMCDTIMKSGETEKVKLATIASLEKVTGKTYKKA